MNKVLIIFIALLSMKVAASESFRLENGKLLLVGQSKSELISLAGVPLYEDVQTVAIDTGEGNSPTKKETLTYRLAGSIGGFYLVEVKLENSVVTSIIKKQEKRN